MQAFAKMVLGVTVAATILSQTAVWAGDKKKAEPFKDIIIDGELINADLKDKMQTGSFCKTYTLKMEQGKSYQVEVGSQNFQCLLRLEDASGKQVAQAIDQFGNRKAVLFFQPTKTEDYEIVVTTINGGATGKFNLAIKDASNSMVLAVRDKIDQNDKNYAPAGGKKHKAYEVILEEGRTYQIDMTSGNFDSYLYFESPEGKVLAQDDDGGGYPSAKIVYKVTKTGKYKVIATYFGGGPVNGEYNVTLRQTDGPARTIINEKKDIEKK